MTVISSQIDSYTLLETNQLLNFKNNFSTLSFELTPEKIVVSKRYTDGQVQSSRFKRSKEAITGQSLHHEYSRIVSFTTIASFLHYLAFVDRYQELPGDKEAADYVENLYCEELNQMVQTVSKEEALQLLSPNNNIIVRPSYTELDCFYVIKRFQDGQVREYPYQVIKENPSDPLSEFIIKGHALLQEHEKKLTFTSAVDLQRYLEFHKGRKKESKLQEEVTLHVDLLMLSYKKCLPHNKKAILWQSRSDPTKLWLLKPAEAPGPRKIFFQCEKTQERGYKSGFKIRHQGASSSVSFTSASAFLGYIEGLYSPQEKIVPKRLFTQDEFQLIQQLLTTSPKKSTDELEEKLLRKNYKKLLHYPLNSLRINEASLCTACRV